MSKDNSKNPFKDIMDLVDDAMDVVDKHSDIIPDAGGSTDVDLTDESILREVYKDEDKVLITIGDVDGLRGQMTMYYDDGDVVIQHSGDRLKVDAPNDVNIDNAEYEMNNGVLDIEIPRTGTSLDIDGE